MLVPTNTSGRINEEFFLLFFLYTNREPVSSSLSWELPDNLIIFLLLIIYDTEESTYSESLDRLSIVYGNSENEYKEW